MKTRAVLLLALLSALTISCGDDKATKPPPPPDPFVVREIPTELQPDLGSLVAGNTDFAFRLYGRLRDREGNLFLSPYSISTALAMTWAGARGQTETEMAQALALPFAQERLHVVFGALQDNLQTGAGLGGYRLAIANRLWGEPGHAWLAEFLRITNESYDAPLQELDFAGQREESRRTINLWVKQRTEERIPELLPPGSIGPATSLVLTNAIYFKGVWQYQFDPRSTSPGSFYVSPSETLSVPMMRGKAEYKTGIFDAGQVLALPFRGRDLSLVVLLPWTNGTVRDVEDRLTQQNLENWMGRLEARDTSIWFPKYGFSSKFGLHDALAALGMSDAFQPGGADFSGMDGTRGFSLQEIYHEAFIQVDEVGAEAAAATGGVPLPSGPFMVDHPFVFLIYDHVTHSVLFLGRVTRPVG